MGDEVGYVLRTWGQVPTRNVNHVSVVVSSKIFRRLLIVVNGLHIYHGRPVDMGFVIQKCLLSWDAEATEAEPCGRHG